MYTMITPTPKTVYFLMVLEDKNNIQLSVYNATVNNRSVGYPFQIIHFALNPYT